MTIYLDIVFFENFILNYIIILSTAIISKSRIRLISIMISSIIGGIFSILNYMMNIDSLENMIFKIIISVLMMLVAFKEYKIKKLIKQLLFFYLVSFTFGGIAFMLLFFIKPQNIVMKSNHLVGTYPLKITVLAGILGFVVIFLIEKIIKDRLNKKSMICDLEIFYNGKIRKIKTMIDTGNLLKEPISKNDVIIVEKESLEGIVSKDILENIKYILKGKWLQEESIHSYRIKLIPFSSLGNDNGLLIGFKPDYVKIYSDDEIIRSDVLIGIYDGKLSKANQYSSLIGLDILNKEGKKNEFVQNV